MGALVSVAPAKLSQSSARALSIAALVALLGGVLYLRLLHMNALPAEYLIGILTSLLVYTIIPQKSVSSRSFYSTLAGFFSRISYSLYCIHLPVAVFLCAVIN
jgi:peptidoglycan/LPS O-acetylase OafA/YrhL